MSPREFIEHPQAMFHATTRLNINLHDTRSDDLPMHLGTNEAATARIAISTGSDSTMSYPMYAFHKQADPSNVDVSLRDHMTNNKSERLSPDKLEQARRLPDADFVEHGGYYYNVIEDPGSISYVSHSAKQELTSHHEAVAKAISEGKRHEVHPGTLAMYDSGKLREPVSRVVPVEAKKVYVAAEARQALATKQMHQYPDNLSAHPGAEHSTQLAWVFGGRFNLGLHRKNPQEYIHGDLEDRHYDEKLGHEWGEKVDAFSLLNDDSIVTSSPGHDLELMRAHPYAVPRGPDLDRIRHYYRAGGWTQ
jgi:hypothetical protein